MMEKQSCSRNDLNHTPRSAYRIKNLDRLTGQFGKASGKAVMLQSGHGGAQCLNVVFFLVRGSPNSFNKAQLFVALRVSDQTEERASE